MNSIENKKLNEILDTCRGAGKTQSFKREFFISLFIFLNSDKYKKSNLKMGFRRDNENLSLYIQFLENIYFLDLDTFTEANNIIIDFIKEKNDSQTETTKIKTRS